MKWGSAGMFQNSGCSLAVEWSTFAAQFWDQRPLGIVLWGGLSIAPSLRHSWDLLGAGGGTHNSLAYFCLKPDQRAAAVFGTT